MPLSDRWHSQGLRFGRDRDLRSESEVGHWGRTPSRIGCPGRGPAAFRSSGDTRKGDSISVVSCPAVHSVGGRHRAYPLTARRQRWLRCPCSRLLRLLRHVSLWASPLARYLSLTTRGLLNLMDYGRLHLPRSPPGRDRQRVLLHHRRLSYRQRLRHLIPHSAWPELSLGRELAPAGRMPRGDRSQEGVPPLPTTTPRTMIPRGTLRATPRMAMDTPCPPLAWSAGWMCPGTSHGRSMPTHVRVYISVLPRLL